MRSIAFLMIALLVIPTVNSRLAALVIGRELSIEERISSGINWILEQAKTYYEGKEAFAEGPLSGDARVFTEDNSHAAMMLAANILLHNAPVSFERWKSGMEFILEAQAQTGDFYEFYEIATKSWMNSGKFYHWNAYVIFSLAYSAYYLRDEGFLTPQYSDRIVEAAKRAIDSWSPITVGQAGEWRFSSVNDSETAEVGNNGVVLSSLLYTALYEKRWGSPQDAERYAALASKLAQWLLNMQETDENLWGYGGFYQNETKTLQRTDSNGLAMLGVNTYWKTIGVLKPGFEPSPDEIRRRMRIWADAFVRKMTDSYSGPYESRGPAGIAEYPKTSWNAASIMQSLVDVWINLGDNSYWQKTNEIYRWMTGNNELQYDLQGAAGSGGKGFHEGIGQNGQLLKTTGTRLTAFATYSMVRSLLISIPEFDYRILPVLFLVFMVLLRTSYGRSSRVVKKNSARISKLEDTGHG